MQRTSPPERLQRTPWAEQHPLLTAYYDEEWGMPVTDEPGLYERLSLEAFQAGLSWLTVLQKRPAIREAFADFSPDAVSRFGPADVERILAAPGVIRNRRKIEAVIGNARAILRLRDAGIPIEILIWSHLPERTPVPHEVGDIPSATVESEELARVLKSHGFRFVGPVTVYALMSAIGMADLHLASSHRRGCSGLWNPDGSRHAEWIERLDGLSAGQLARGTVG